MPDQPIVYDDVEVLEHDSLGFTCRIGAARVFIGKYVPMSGTAIARKGDRGRLTLPRWFVEQQGLALEQHLTDQEVEAWFAAAKLRAASAQDRAEKRPRDAEAQAGLERALGELSAAMVIRARRQGEPR